MIQAIIITVALFTFAAHPAAGVLLLMLALGAM